MITAIRARIQQGNIVPEEPVPIQDGQGIVVILEGAAKRKWSQLSQQERTTIASRVCGSLAFTHTSSDEFARRKAAEKAKEDRRWR